MDLGYNLVCIEDWFWDVNFIYFYICNEVIKFGEGLVINFGGFLVVNVWVLEGFFIGVLWGLRMLCDESGDIVFDENGFL